MNQQQSSLIPPDTTLEREVAAMIVTALNLEVGADEIQPDAALFGDGLGLDSIDILEISFVISKTYGIQMKAENEDNFNTFSSLRSLTAYIAEHRTN
ncbi:MAG: acyl carrier [Gallionellaceae bacterium]|nr:MAG: acyl carrier [Gallionellaceae bacterium]